MFFCTVFFLGWLLVPDDQAVIHIVLIPEGSWCHADFAAEVLDEVALGGIGEHGGDFGQLMIRVAQQVLGDINLALTDVFADGYPDLLLEKA